MDTNDTNIHGLMEPLSQNHHNLTLKIPCLHSLNVLLLNDVWQNIHGHLITSPTTRINVGIVYFYKTTGVLQQCVSLGSIL